MDSKHKQAKKRLKKTVTVFLKYICINITLCNIFLIYFLNMLSTQVQ